MGNRFSPFFTLSVTPTLQLNSWLLPSLVVILDLIFLYILWIKSKHFPLIPWWVSLCHRPALQTVSNACLKSTKQQNSFFLLDCDISIKLLRIHRLSDVEKCFLKPDCEPLIISYLSALLLSLLFIIAVKCFPNYLATLLVGNFLDPSDILCLQKIGFILPKVQLSGTMLLLKITLKSFT